jgi:integrase
MVWTAAQCGAFLDSLEASEEPKHVAERLYALFHLAAYSGMRRSELAGLGWADVDLDRARVHIRQAQVDDELDSTKSEESNRQIRLIVQSWTRTLLNMTPEEAEQLLIEWVMVTRDRDNRVRWAVAAGVSKYRVNQLTGISRTTIDSILATSEGAGRATGASQ